jgi:hypothetical protein
MTATIELLPADASPPATATWNKTLVKTATMLPRAAGQVS